MSDRRFIDTNVLVYAFDDDAPREQELARELLAGDGAGGRLVLSAQVLGEFYVTVTRKLKRPLSAKDAAVAVDHLSMLPTIAIDARLVLAAVAASRTRKLSYWDALIIEAARRAGCDEVLSQDLQDGGDYGGVRVTNPFGAA